MLPWFSSPGQPLSLGQGDGGPGRERGHNISTHLRYSISMLIYTMPSEDKHKCIVTHTCMSTSFLIIFPSAHIRPPRASPVKTEAFSMRLTSSPPYQHRYKISSSPRGGNQYSIRAVILTHEQSHVKTVPLLQQLIFVLLDHFFHL